MLPFSRDGFIGAGAVLFMLGLDPTDKIRLTGGSLLIAVAILFPGFFRQS